jgi:hypothetical protein
MEVDPLLMKLETIPTGEGDPHTIDFDHIGFSKAAVELKLTFRHTLQVLFDACFTCVVDALSN